MSDILGGESNKHHITVYQHYDGKYVMSWKTE